MRMDGQVGGYPIKFLEQIVRLSKCLKMKRERISQLRDLNTQGEKRKSFGEFITGDFQRRYIPVNLNQFVQRNIFAYQMSCF